MDASLLQNKGLTTLFLFHRAVFQAISPFLHVDGRRWAGVAFGFLFQNIIFGFARRVFDRAQAAVAATDAAHASLSYALQLDVANDDSFISPPKRLSGFPRARG